MQLSVDDAVIRSMGMGKVFKVIVGLHGKLYGIGSHAQCRSMVCVLSLAACGLARTGYRTLFPKPTGLPVACQLLRLSSDRRPPRHR